MKISVFAVLAVLVSNLIPLQADVCLQAPFETNLDWAEVVFVATVDHVVVVGKKSGKATDQTTVVFFNIEKYWKGEVSQTAVLVDLHSAGDGFQPAKGQRYLIYTKQVKTLEYWPDSARLVKGMPDSIFFLPACSRSTRLPSLDAEDDIVKLGPGKRPGEK